MFLAVKSMPNHKYMILEHCLYYSIQSHVDVLQGQTNAIALLPPSDGKKQKNITISFVKMILQHYYLVSVELHIFQQKSR